MDSNNSEISQSAISSRRRRNGVIALLAVFLVLGLILWQTWEYWLPQGEEAVVQSAPAPDGGPPPGGGRGGFPNPQDARRRLHEDIKAALEADNDDAWEKLRPKVERVTDLQEQLRPRPGAAMRPGGPRPPGDGAGVAGAAATSDFAEKTEMLRAAVDDDQTPPEALAANLSAARAARKKLEAELKTAQDDLRKDLNPRQEAALAALGVLD